MLSTSPVSGFVTVLRLIGVYIQFNCTIRKITHISNAFIRRVHHTGPRVRCYYRHDNVLESTYRQNCCESYCWSKWTRNLPTNPIVELNRTVVQACLWHYVWMQICAVNKDFNGIFGDILRAACALSCLYRRIVVAHAHIESSSQATDSELLSEDASSELTETGTKWAHCTGSHGTHWMVVAWAWSHAFHIFLSNLRFSAPLLAGTEVSLRIPIFSFQPSFQVNLPSKSTTFTIVTITSP